MGGRFRRNPWSIRALKRWKSPIDISEGDKLVFRWRKSAGVIRILPGAPENDFSDSYLGGVAFYNCDTSNALATVLKKESESGSVTYQVTRKDWGPLFFVSANKQQCKDGLRLQTAWIRCQEPALSQFCVIT